MLSVGSQRESSTGAGDAECLARCVTNDLLRMSGFFLGMGCGRQLEHPDCQASLSPNVCLEGGNATLWAARKWHFSTE